MRLAGFKDWRTTIPTIIAVVCGFIVLYPQHFPAIAQDFAKFVGLGGLGALGINAASNAKVKEKTEQKLEQRLLEVVPHQTRANPPKEDAD